jgi:hypothetical protein
MPYAPNGSNRRERDRIVSIFLLINGENVYPCKGNAGNQRKQRPRSGIS